jgi:hypothetical protein
LVTLEKLRKPRREFPEGEANEWTPKRRRRFSERNSKKRRCKPERGAKELNSKKVKVKRPSKRQKTRGDTQGLPKNNV